MVANLNPGEDPEQIAREAALAAQWIAALDSLREAEALTISADTLAERAAGLALMRTSLSALDEIQKEIMNPTEPL